MKTQKTKLTVGLAVEHIRNGKCIDATYKEYDVISDVGLDQICVQVAGVPTNRFGWIAIGTSATAASFNQSALVAEVSKQSAAYTKSGTVGLCNLWAEFTMAASYALNECGVFNSSGAVDKGTMYCRDTYTTKNVLANDIVRVSYNLQWQRV